MNLYYQQNGIEIWHGDCREFVWQFNDETFDVIVADPPYGETSLHWDERVAGWPAMVMPTLKGSGSLWCFGSLRYFMQERDEFTGWKFAQEIVWEKHNGSIFHADRFRRVHEFAAQWYWGDWAGVYKRPQFTQDATKRTARRKTRPAHSGHIEGSTYTSEDGGPRLMRSVIQVRSCHGYAKHPTQKPEGIVRPLLAYSLPPGGLVLDPFVGSGTTLVVARELGAKAIGIEIEERYCEIAARRLSQMVLPMGVA
jgi:site-specific DNA-methyltransferase (adenine-specific)